MTGQARQRGTGVPLPQGQTQAPSKALSRSERPGHGERGAPQEHGGEGWREERPPRREHETQARVLPHDRAVVRKRRRARRLAAAGGDGERGGIGLPSRGEVGWRAPAPSERGQQCVVEVDEGLALVMDRIVVAPGHQVVGGRQRQAETTERTGQGRRAAAVHAHHEHPRPLRHPLSRALGRHRLQPIGPGQRYGR